MTDDETRFRAPRLTRLELQGFKSFLHRTVFAFEPGITAIVGPNGSGKSNVADALRWVLGEQGQHALRARKTEDVIFSGGQGRAPAGMAEATLTFDNTEGWLPTEFAEVSVTRRAFRSGENQYLINGRKVRLKDVAQLTAGLGQSHVVVGQGLVDAALSQRAEERRGLFEHAADLTGLRLKVAEAERNLAETDANTTRLNDLLVELAPRLRSLERAARQSREWQSLRDRLRDLQGVHFRAALETSSAQLGAAREDDARAELAATAALGEEESHDRALDEAATRLTTARADLADHDERRGVVEATLRRQTHERDLAAARAESLARRRADMDDARAGLDERVASVAKELVKLAGDLRELERATAESREAAARFTRELSSRRQTRVDLDKRLAEAGSSLAESQRREGELLRRRAVLDERAASLGAELDRLRLTISEREERIAALTADTVSADAASVDDDDQRQALETRLASISTALQCAAALAVALRTETDRLQRSRGEAATRLEVLRRMQESGAGLHGGVKEVMTAARGGRLDGIEGTVAELLEVPKSLEMAIEVTLGGRLQDVVVSRWVDAEAAIAHLKQTGTGRATFQPIDSVRGGNASQPPMDIQRQRGFLGVAAALVHTAPRHAVIASALLGRTIVVEDLEAARGALRTLPPGWSVVTVPGEIARAGGSVTGGSAARESGTLGRERELRELPRALAEIEGSLAEAQERVADADAAVASGHAEQRQAEGERSALQAAAIERRQQRLRLRGWLAELHGEQARSEQRLAALSAERDQVEGDRRALEMAAAEAAERRNQLQATRIEAEAARDELIASSADIERGAAEEGRRLAGLEERLRGERRREAGLRSQERALAEELALRAERSAQLDRERASLAADHDRLAHQAAASAEALDLAMAEGAPRRQAVHQAEHLVLEHERAVQRTRTERVERERARDHAGFALERAAQEWRSLRERIVDDLEIVDADDVLAWESALPVMPTADREAEISRLRERLRRVGYAGDDAVADFDRESAQQVFLREQLADVEGASAALRNLLADLRLTMRGRFNETFALVAEAFAQAFATLFGGGTARLVLTTGETGAEPGIEIVAQPPGKRLQNLALLSGGERALTAAALLFAILQVNPAPFCLLDEVDAALDEANVVRFREQLHILASQTQIIVVTHNRGTIEIADTLYGVSMGADGVSQVLSLRMTESLPAD